MPIIVASHYWSSYGDDFDFKGIFRRRGEGLPSHVIGPNGQVCKHVNGQVGWQGQRVEFFFIREMAA